MREQKKLNPKQPGGCCFDDDFRELKEHGTAENPVVFYESVFHRQSDYGLHWHKEMEIIYVICGTLFVRMSGEVVEGHTGDFIFIEPETVHHITSGGELLRFKSFVFSPRVLNGCEDDFCQNVVAQPLVLRQLRVSDRIFPGQVRYEEIKSAFFELSDCCDKKEDFYQLRAKVLLLQLFYEILSGGHYSMVSLSTGKVSAAVRDALEYIEHNYSSDITAKTISGHVHYNEYYFMRVFKKYTGKTLVEYITQLRLDKSKGLLLGGDTVEEAAFQVGFSSTSYFTSKFKEAFGVTPSEFRRLTKQK